METETDCGERELRKKYESLEKEHRSLRDLARLSLRQNQRKIDLLRKEQKEMKCRLARKNEITRGGGGRSKIEEELSELDKSLNDVKRRSDKLEQKKNSCELQLQRIRQSMSDLKKGDPVRSRENVLKSISTIKMQLDQAIEKQEESLNEKKRAEGDLANLAKEIENTEVTINILEKSVKAKNDDLYFLEQLCKDAMHARDSAKQDASQAKYLMEAQRQKLQKSIEEQKNRLKAAEDLTFKMREKNNSKKIASLKSYNYSSVYKWIKSISNVKEPSDLCQKVKKQLSEISELQQKEQHLKDLNNNMSKKKQELQERVAEMNRNSESLNIKEVLGRYQDEKMACVVSKDESELCLKSQRAELKNIKAKLKEMTEFLMPISSSIPNLPLSDYTLIEVILQCGTKLGKLLKHPEPTYHRLTQF